MILGEYENYAILASRCKSEEDPPLTLFTGTSFRATSLADLDTSVDFIAAIPFRQGVERGFDCNDDGKQIVGIRCEDTEEIRFDDFVERFAGRIAIEPIHYSETNEEYASSVQTCVDGEIGSGECSNVVLHRVLSTRFVEDTEVSTLTLFANLLAGEAGYYRAFLFKTEEGFLVGASPEKHIRCIDGKVSMTAISGTTRIVGAIGDCITTLLQDDKEQNELHMVVDEELKMMSSICDTLPVIAGPCLRIMSEVIHTEFDLSGDTKLDPISILQRSLFAPTVVGSPLENAMRVIKRRESHGRGYYAGVLAEVFRVEGRDYTPTAPQLDSSILIRFADISNDGQVSIPVGSTITRQSIGTREAEETEHKARALLNALNGKKVDMVKPQKKTGGKTWDDEFEELLSMHSERLSHFWRSQREILTAKPVESPGKQARIILVDNEDSFTEMWKQVLIWQGHRLEVIHWSEVSNQTILLNSDICVLGPGPGDPREIHLDRQKKIADLIKFIERQKHPCIAVCLSHQIYCFLHGLPLRKRRIPNQGLARKTVWNGKSEYVGFYNSFEAHTSAESIDFHGVINTGPGGIIDSIISDELISVQFHPESILSTNGNNIIRSSIDHLLGKRNLD